MADNQAPDYMAQYDYAANGYNPDGRLIDALKSTWKPTDPVKLQTMDQMLAGDNSGKSFNPTEHGYEWNADYGRFMNPNGSTILVNPDGSVVNATPAYKDYEFNGQYFNPAGENVSWNPEKNQSAYKLGGVEVPIGRENMKGIAAYTDQSNNPQMQIDRSGQAIFTEPEGLRYTGNFMDDTGAPILAGLVLGGTTALASGAFGAGTTLAGEAATTGISSADLGTTLTNVPSSTVPYSNIGISSADLGATGTNVAYDGIINNAAPYAGDSQYAAQDVMQQARDTAMSSGPTAWNTGNAGMSTMQKIMLARAGMNALGQMTGGGGTSGGGGGGGGSLFNYSNNPYLSNAQQNTIQMKTGRDVSGMGTTTAGYPVGLDTSRQAALMANLLRG